VPALGWKLLSGRGRVTDDARVRSFKGLSGIRVRACEVDGELRPFPLQVDGDYVSDCTEVAFSVQPGALAVVA
jgi:diacylglycerol kinase family enzyme